MLQKHFIWLNEEKYPEYQKTFCTVFDKSDEYQFGVVGFRKQYHFKKKINTVVIRIYADTKYFLYLNGRWIGSGPVCPGGDYGNKTPMPVQYYSTYVVEKPGQELNFFVLVQLSPGVQCDMSLGRGGLCMEAFVTLEDGSTQTVSTDETWEGRLETQYVSLNDMDLTRKSEEWSPAVLCENVWNLKESPILNLTEEMILPIAIEENDQNIFVDFDKIYAGYIVLEINAPSEFSITIETCETKSKHCGTYTVKGKGKVSYRSMRLDSIGELVIRGIRREYLKEIYLIYSHYPTLQQGEFQSSDEVLNKIFQVGKHTTEICRQSIELDSPNHQENLGCTGDYFIESLVSYYCFGDTSLSAFDVLRTAQYLCMTRGKMFHTTYSLIWVNMLYDNYLFSGDVGILQQCEAALTILLDRFWGYVGDNHVIDNPPDYMFVDWVPVDEFNLHHPPKALGQTVLNAFYYNALCLSEKIYQVLDRNEHSKECRERADLLKKAFHECFYDEERGLYIAGLNTEYEPNKWLPPNTSKKYYLKHANVLAALYDLDDNGRELMDRVMHDDTLIDVQPYFMHFVLEAIYHTGLFEKYGIREIYRWKEMVDECDKGMKEAWGKFPGYDYDYSHAWGATPTYQLMSKITGLQILEPGFRKISLKPNLFGLESVKVIIPTPYGMIKCELGRENKIEVCNNSHEI